MNDKQFCLWLRGCLDINEGNELSQKQIKIIKEKLNSIFEHIVNNNVVQCEIISNDYIIPYPPDVVFNC